MKKLRKTNKLVRMMTSNISFESKILNAFIPFFSKYKPLDLYWITKHFASAFHHSTNLREEHNNYFINSLMDVFLRLAAVENNWSNFYFKDVKEFPLKHIFENEPFDFPLDATQELDLFFSRLGQVSMDIDIKDLIPLFDFRKVLLVLYISRIEGELGVVEKRYLDEFKKSA